MKTILLTIILAVAAHTITARTDTTYYDAFGNITTAEHLQGGKAIVPKLYHVTGTADRHGNVTCWLLERPRLG
jgi:YD repeat-containing protein